MSDPYFHDDRLLVQVLRMNWEHARYVETQRLYLTVVYAALAAGIAYEALYSGDPVVKIAASAFGLATTLIFWGMIRKLSSEFVNQIAHADRCARQLMVQVEGGRGPIPLHAFLGFPRKAIRPFAVLGAINVGLMFRVLFGTFTLAWVFLLGYRIFRIFALELVL
jgi:hypothetical protein